jgi:hypothetical protein
VETDEARLVREKQEAERTVRRKRDAVQKRFNEITAKTYELERQNALLVDAMLKGQQPRTQPQQTDGPPEREQFEDYESYLVAKATYAAERKAEERLQKATDEANKRAQDAHVQRTAAEISRDHQNRIKEYAKSTPDFHEVVDGADANVPDATAAAILKRADGPALIYAISKDPSIAEKLHGMEPYEQLMYLGELSASLKSKPPQVSNAPAPGKPVGSKSAPTVPLEDLDYDAFVKRRRQQIAARNR